MKVNPELVRYYHEAAGFPTKPSSIAATNNKHYAYWPGKNTPAVAKYFPNSDEMWKVNGRKIESGLLSMKKQATREIVNEISI